MARQPSPHAEQLATAVRDLVTGTLRKDTDAAHEILTGIGHPITDVERRSGVSLATTCWLCNTGKADLTLQELGWDLLDVEAVRSAWDGLTGSDPDLCRLAGTPDEGYHRTGPMIPRRRGDCNYRS